VKVLPTEIPGVVLIEPTVHRDARGFFLESYNSVRYREHGIDAVFVQDNHSRSAGGTVRGLHAQRLHPQGKLVRVLRGEVWDVAVDIRRGSPSFGRHVAARLSGENFRQIYIPPGFAHGFAVVSDEAEFEYKCTDFYHPEDELGIAWDDPDLGIPWPVDAPILSEKDRRLPRLAEIRDLLPEFRI
jgi:dTDP-4-dehydrorhamnose 3,5-epimerase